MQSVVTVQAPITLKWKKTSGNEYSYDKKIELKASVRTCRSVLSLVRAIALALPTRQLTVDCCKHCLPRAANTFEI